MTCVKQWWHDSFTNMINTMMIQQYDDDTIAFLLVIFMETLYCS